MAREDVAQKQGYWWCLIVKDVGWIVKAENFIRPGKSSKSWSCGDEHRLWR